MKKILKIFFGLRYLISVICLSKKYNELYFSMYVCKVIVFNIFIYWENKNGKSD